MISCGIAVLSARIDRLVLCVSVVVCVAGACWLAETSSGYRATAVIEMSPPKQPFLLSRAANPRLATITWPRRIADTHSMPNTHTFMALVDSQFVRQKVQVSFSEAERALIRTASAGDLSGHEALNRIKVGSNRRSFQATITALHHNPRAAELIANRYAQVALTVCGESYPASFKFTQPVVAAAR